MQINTKGIRNVKLTKREHLILEEARKIAAEIEFQLEDGEAAAVRQELTSLINRYPAPAPKKAKQTA